MTSKPLVHTVRHGAGQHVVEVRIDRDEALNAISLELGRQFVAAAAAIAGDPTVRVAVLSSACSRAFSVGADLVERRGVTEADLAAQRPHLSAVYEAFRLLDVPTIAAIHGFALGGGFELALACDYIIADVTAVIALPEVKVGGIPGGGGTQLLPRRVGWGRAAEIIFTGRRLAHDEALQLGLVDRVVPAGQHRSAALEVAELIAANSPTAVRAAKAAMRTGGQLPLAAGLAVEESAWYSLLTSPDRSEGVAAFTEKRPPRWVDPA